MHIVDFDKSEDVASQIRIKASLIGSAVDQQRAALIANYTPVMSCNNEVLFRTR